MTEILVGDATVALKWVLPEDDRERADGLLEFDAELHAPAFVFMEMANALWYQVRQDKLAAEGCLRDLRQSPLDVWRGEEPLPATLELARVLDHAVYDCAYLALGLHLGGRYLTADRRFWRKARQGPHLAESVVLLAQWR